MNETASIVMTIALMFYTIGVWSEKIQGRLSFFHLLLFVFGLIFDTIGTSIMFSVTDGISFSFHGIVGLVAITLMMFHAIWAIIVLLNKEEALLSNFHKYSLFVWLVWLIPYLSPVFMHLA